MRKLNVKKIGDKMPGEPQITNKKPFSNHWQGWPLALTASHFKKDVLIIISRRLARAYVATPRSRNVIFLKSYFGLQ